MTTMERIKEIEHGYHMFCKGCEDPGCDYEIRSFLLKAFEAMREVAAEESYAYGEACATKSEALRIIDEEFEERMK